MDTNQENSFKLSGTLKKILFFNSENNYYIAVLENDQKICGQYFDTTLEKLVGSEIILEGRWNTHHKYGVQFIFTKLPARELLRRTLDLGIRFAGLQFLFQAT